MKKVHLIAFLALAQASFAQYMIIGKDSIAVQNFIKDNQYGLEHAGIDKTISSIQDFTLLQQFAKEQKADTLSYFRDRIAQVDSNLREKYFYPEKIVDGVLQDYVHDNITERQMLLFAVQKKAEDKTDYQKVYNDVVSGKMTMEEAVKTYMGTEAKPVYMKAGVIDDAIYSQLLNVQPGSYTKLFNNSAYAAFAKLIKTRPSLGYLIFATVSYPNDASAEKTKTAIFDALKSGKKFDAIAKEYGSSDQEKKNGGLVMGSPTLPENVYDALKGKKAGEYTQPILMDDKYFIFYVYQAVPYEINADTKDFFKREMMSSVYFERVQDQLLAQLKASGKFREGKDLASVKKSYQAYTAFKNSNAILATYGKHQLKFGDLKDDLTKNMKDLDQASPEDWGGLIDAKVAQFVVGSYSDDFDDQPEIATQLNEARKNLYSEYIFTQYLKKEVDAHPEWLTEYYSKNRDKYMWDERAEVRVAVLADPKMKSEIESEIKKPANWEALKKKFDGQLNDKKQVLVHFEEGKLEKDADIFASNNVPFKPGVYDTKVKERDVVMAVDRIVPKEPMTEKEAEDLLRDAVTEQKLRETINAQKAKTNIVIQPAFMKELEKKFKK